MTSLPELLAGAERQENGFRCTVPSTWLQGRTAYGGLSGALALHAAQASEADLPPLRSAQVAFVGPLAGEVTVTATRLRRGRNAAFIQSDIVSEAGLGYRATYVFMADIASTAERMALPGAPVPTPAPDAAVITGSPEFFTGNFEFVDSPPDQLKPAEWMRWVRLRERDGLDPAVELMAVGDALPPAAIRLMQARAPVSSMTWIVNLLVPRPTTRDGWWLLNADADFARGGFSSQRMTLWNADGEPVAEGMQGVAVFG